MSRGSYKVALDLFHFRGISPLVTSSLSRSLDIRHVSATRRNPSASPFFFFFFQLRLARKSGLLNLATVPDHNRSRRMF